MILRRFSESPKEQNRTTILIEFVLPVAGVFLGIQAANWKKKRAEDAGAQACLARMPAACSIGCSPGRKRRRCSIR